MKRCPLLFVSAVCAASCLLNCKDVTPRGRTDAAGGSPASASGPQFVRASVRRNPAMVVSALVDVEAPGAERITVRYGNNLGDAYETPALTPAADGRVTAVLIGLRPGVKTLIKVEARARDRSLSSLPLTFVADAPPPDIAWPEVRVVTDDGSARGFLLGPFRSDRGKAAVMLDRRGRVLWYRPLVGVEVGAFSRLPNGHFIMWNILARAFEEVDIGGSVVRRWIPDPAASEDGADGHEFLPLPGDRAVVIGWQYHGVDSRTRFPDGSRTAQRRDNTVVELDAQGSSRVIWASYPQIGIDEIRPLPETKIDPTRFETVHANAVDLSSDGELVAVTCREIGQVLGIERRTGKVRWRLGGKRGDLRILDDPLEGFSAPHDARLLPGNRLRVFDNGNLHRVPVSRVVVYEIDEAARVARLVWEYVRDPPLYTEMAGSARDLPNDRLLIDFTLKGRIIEVDRERRVHWEMKLVRGWAYRIEWVPTMYP
jgi:hypothetical protein